MRAEDKERAVAEVVARIVAAAGDGRGLDAAIADTIYNERRRIEKERSSGGRAAALERWDERRRALLATNTTDEKKALLAKIAEDFAREVLGNFNPKVHRFATKLLPVALSGLLNAMSPVRIVKNFRQLPSVKDRLIVDGMVDEARELKDRGTLIVCPTHLSNLDSIVLGYAFYDAGFPPLTYGAGLNLFTNKLISYFMHNLGAYKVDRRKTAAVYKDVLKEYATVSLEYGYHNLFFPGGTRSRSGAIESKLKLGLLGCGLRAYINNLRGGREKPNIYVIPVTITSELVLEAETLVDDFLKETGQSRYIIVDDEFSQPSRIVSFLERIFELDAKIYITLGQPLDPFGNNVRRDGVSVDARGRPIDTVRYVVDQDEKPIPVKARDEEYTRELGNQLAIHFHRNSTVMGSHLIAFAVYEALREQQPSQDLYRFLRSTDGELDFAMLAKRVEQLRSRIEMLASQGKIRVDDRLRGKTGDELVMAGLRSLSQYHKRLVIERKGDKVVAVDRNLLYYYRNRLLGFGLEEPNARPEGASARLQQVSQ
ncbi:MAG TPA: 1-acyl-sn-glycerol-3-phosphate acyltransferase [Planctomycetota bacterium]|nr:1-acyl-sn-glycerol-3-phosphate acyltransferase [Planctomycetota bacterium]